MKKYTLGIVLVLLTSILAYYFLHETRTNSSGSSHKKQENPSIAILPFENSGAVIQPDSFNDDLTENIINAVGHIKGLKVCARTSSFKFKGKNIDAREAGRQLNVNTILEGSVTQKEDRILVEVQLIDVEDGAHFWSAQYDEKAEDIFLVQNKIAQAIADHLEISLTSENRSNFEIPTNNRDAYQLYLKGRALWNAGTPPELQKAIVFFQQAIQLDTNFAIAYSGIADCYDVLGYGSILAPSDVFPKAKQAALKALAIDSNLAEPYAALGFISFYYDWDWAESEDQFRKSISRNPNYEIGYKWYAYYLTAMRRYEEASVLLKKAAEIDPLSVPISTDIGFNLYYQGSYQNAIDQLKKALQANPRFPLAHLWLGRSYQAQKMYPAAIDEYKKALEVSPGWTVGLAQIGNVYGVSGMSGEAQTIADSLETLSGKKFVTAYGRALVFAGLNQNDKAFAFLQKAYEERSNWLVWLRADPRWMPLRTDKRFLHLIAQVGLPE